jgi:hypothetical protein
MPYIERDNRINIKDYFHDGLMNNVITEGELNYLVSLSVHEWLKEKGLKYKNINAAIGVLECAKLELYRMVAASYEDGKRKMNGSVSSLDKD